MATAVKFLFETSFDEEPPAPEEVAAEVAAATEPEVVIPAFSEDDMLRARTEGFAEGKAEGLREAGGTIERHIADVLDVVSGRLAELLADRIQARDHATRDAVSVAATIARKLLPDLDRRNALGEVERVVGMAMERVLEEPKLTIEVNGAIEPALAERLPVLAREAGFEGKVVLQIDDSLDLGDCRVEWASGGAARDTARLWQEIDAIIERNLGASDGPPPEGSGPQDGVNPPPAAAAGDPNG